MNVFLWVPQAVLAAVFGLAGVMHSTLPKERLRPMLPWVEDFTPTRIRLIGVAELLGALGLILPAATGIAPILTPLAAAGLAITMLGAAATHVRRKEPAAVAVNVVLLALTALIAWGRF
ncbi:DoxX family protein [Nonomuraea sp. NPDC049625]|uniref:DoxX family protein n=1 Tax=Nonomuraea sp. NPDC049625 TaxID=3155775 RepID=UPI003423A5EF